MAALRRVLPTMELDVAALRQEQLLDIEVAIDDFMAAFREVAPSALREVLVEVPSVRWDDIGGLGAVKRARREIVEWPVHHAKLLRIAGVRPPRGVLLQGPPGTGKTMLAKALATESGANFISVKGPELISKYVGESEHAIREVFRKARQAAPCIVFFDEIDAIAPRRSEGADGHVTGRVVAQILTEMDGVEDLGDVLVLAATNRADILDPALLRPGRFDSVIEINPPDETDRLAILTVHSRAMPLADDVDLRAIAENTEGFSGAELQKLLADGAMNAIREYVASPDAGGELQIRPCDLSTARVSTAARRRN